MPLVGQQKENFATTTKLQYNIEKFHFVIQKKKYRKNLRAYTISYLT
jgi:hypothetical protein